MKRVSLAYTLEGCLTAMPKGGERLEETLKETDGYLLVCELDTTKVPLSMRDIVLPFTLYVNNWVQDALLTEEVWITKPFTAQRLKLIQVTTFEETVEDCVPDWFSPKPKGCPVVTRIENVSYNTIKERVPDENGKPETTLVY